VPRERQLRELVRSQIGLMVNDVIAHSIAACSDAGVAHVDEVRAAGRSLAGFSPKLAEHELVLKRFMYAELYHHESQIEAANAARLVVTDLFAAYCGDPALMGGDWADRMPEEPLWGARHIADYIAGMTDRFALDRYAEIAGSAAVPEVLRRG
jgi:dGTPase